MEDSKDSEHKERRAMMMRKIKVSTKEIVNNAAYEANEARSPGFDNETAAKYSLERMNYTIIKKLGNGAYASVFSTLDPEGK